MGNGREQIPHRLELESIGAEGNLVLMDEDVMAQPVNGEPLFLRPGVGAPGGKQELAPFRIPLDWRRALAPKGFRFFVSMKSSIGQLGGNFRYLNGHNPPDGNMRLEFVNESMHTVKADKPFELGRLMARGKPLTGNPYFEALEKFEIEGDYETDPSRGRLILPIVTPYEESEVDYDDEVDLSTLPTGTRRKALHGRLNITPRGDYEGPGFERFQSLAMTIPIKVPTGACIWINGCEDADGHTVSHGESRALYGGYKWGIVTETHAPVVGGKLIVSVYKSTVVSS